MVKRTIATVVPVIWVVALALGFSAALAGPASAAGGGYAPPVPLIPPPATTPPAPPAPPSACATSVVTSSTLPPGGGTLQGTINGAVVTVTVPSGAFPDGVQVAIVEIGGSVPPNGGTVVLTFGLEFCENGELVTGTGTVAVTDPVIGPCQTLYQQTSSGLVAVPAAQITNGHLFVPVTEEADYVLVSTACAIPAATTVVTGKPFLLEGLIAGGLVLLGTLLLLRLRFRHS